MIWRARLAGSWPAARIACIVRGVLVTGYLQSR
jgi:hypothetical protein